MKMLKNFLTLAFLGMTSTYTGSAVASAAGPEEVPAPISKIFEPVGWDDNDNVEIVLHGEFRNSCYKVGHTTYEVNAALKTIKIKATSYKYNDTACLQVMTPFLQVVKVGIVEKGDYRIVAQGETTVAGDLKVAARLTDAADDYLYATVEDATIDQDQLTGKQTLELRGRYPLMLIGCAVLRDVYIHRDIKDIIVVQPTMEYVNNEECDQGYQINFKKNIQLDEPFTGEGLLHVRVLNGNSLNRYIAF